MDRRYLIASIVLLAAVVIGVKVVLIANGPKPQEIVQPAPIKISVADMDIKVDLPPATTKVELALVHRARVVQEIARTKSKDEAIKILEKMETQHGHPFLKDRIRRAVLALRFDKPVDNYNDDELLKLLKESKR